MCLGDLGQIVELQPGLSAVVRTGTRTTRVSLLTLPDPVALGDWLVCHSGFALSRVTPEAALEAAALRATQPAEPPTNPTTPASATTTANATTPANATTTEVER